MVHGHVGELETQNNSNGQNSLSPIFVKHTVKDRSAQQTRQTVGRGKPASVCVYERYERCVVLTEYE